MMESFGILLLVFASPSRVLDAHAVVTFYIDSLARRSFCQCDLENSILQDSCRFRRINFGRKRQFTGEPPGAELGKNGLLFLFVRMLF